MKKIKIFILAPFFFINSNTYAEDQADISITRQMADYFLLKAPTRKYENPKRPNYQLVDSLTDALYDSNEKIRLSRGYQHYKQLRKMAENANSYAAYHSAMYMIQNKDQLGFSIREALVLLKQASDSGILDAKYALSVIYDHRSEDIATLINLPQAKEGKKLSKAQTVKIKEQIKVDADSLKKIGIQYTLELAQSGYAKSFYRACGYYLTGDYLEQSIAKASMCYGKAISAYDVPEAYGRLAKIYFDANLYDTLEYEKKGFELAEQGMQKGDDYAMAVLGKQLIYPKHVSYSNPDLGLVILKKAEAQGSAIASDYIKKYFDGSGRLIRPSTKPKYQALDSTKSTIKVYPKSED
ncbi:hypothetical protein A7M79_00875 [Acinetobacter baumannii]|uniref:hypothetical protein n=1 Tax=Acinetobacter baumannii TaxID=470 RepID=UPI0008DD0B94|nr:hypothetical protein [Acinetobacter baumannii]OIH12072.1 hypothetical protein A7M79_00875 [Acinetobacter baumannii]